MVEEMEKLKAANQSSSSKNPYKTPPPKISAPTPEKPPVAPPVEVAPPVTEAARLARLRRLCEKKPSGKCSVPEAVHLQWKNASKVEREHMIDELEKAGWSKDCGFTNPIKQRSLNTLEDLIPVFSSYSFSNDSQLIVASLFGRNCSLAASPKCLRRPTSYRSARNVGGSRKMQCPRFWDGVGV